MFGCVPCLGGKDHKRIMSAARFQKRRNSLRGNFVTKYVTPIEIDFTMEDKPLGKGAFGVVMKAYNNKNSRAFAVKFISKLGHLSRIEREIKLLTDIDHANIIRLFSVYDNDNQVGFVFDLCTGGDLTEFIRKSPQKYLHEDFAKGLIRQLVSAIAHIHSRGICHRDIKLQNILLENMDTQNAQIKLIDFGFATRFVGVTPMKTRCGTPYSTAPEVFRECYDERCDVWSAGVVSYFLLCGHRPFQSVNLPGDLKKAGRASVVTSILMGRYHFNYPAFRLVSAEGINFIQKMLSPRYTSRWHAVDALNCQWLSGKFIKATKVDFRTLKNKDTPLSLAVSNLRTKKKASNLGNTGMVAVAFDHSRYDAPEIRSLFQYFDTENAGFLSKKAFRKAMKSVSPDLNVEEIDNLFEAIDVDNDKQISFTEFLAATMDPREVDMEELSKAFQLLDSDNKGYLTVDDFYRVLAVNPGKYDALQLTSSVKVAKENVAPDEAKDSSSSELSKSGIPYFAEHNGENGDRNNLLRKIAQMIKSADLNGDGVLSYSEFLMGIMGEGNVEEEDGKKVANDDLGNDPNSNEVCFVGDTEKLRVERLLVGSEISPSPGPEKSFYLKSPFGATTRKTMPMDTSNLPDGQQKEIDRTAPRRKSAPSIRAIISQSYSKLRSPKTVPGSPTPGTPKEDDVNSKRAAASNAQSVLSISRVEFQEVNGKGDRGAEADDESIGFDEREIDEHQSSVGKFIRVLTNVHDSDAAQTAVKGPPAWIADKRVIAGIKGDSSEERTPSKGPTRLPPIIF